jgi:hypothetical protein
MVRTCSTLGGKRNAYRSLVGQPEGKRPLRRPDVGEKIILKWMLERNGRYGLD